MEIKCSHSHWYKIKFHNYELWDLRIIILFLLVAKVHIPAYYILTLPFSNILKILNKVNEHQVC